MLRMSGVSHRYPGHHHNTLSDIELLIHDGEIVAISGPSGSGKTTMLSIAGLLRIPTSGTVQIVWEDRIVGRGSEVAWIFQTVNLLGRRSVLENVSLGGLSRGLSLEKAQTEASDAIDRVGLRHRTMARAASLSGGEAQRVAIARALVLRPAAVLADEPTANLDRQSAMKVLEAIFALRRMGTATLIATHDPAVASLADRQYLLEEGLLLQDVAP